MKEQAPDHGRDRNMQQLLSFQRLSALPAPSSRQPTIVLTGASSGIGRAAAVASARTGATLVLASRNEAALQAVADECVRAGKQITR